MSKVEISDGVFDARVVATAAALWPAQDWPNWVVYDSYDQNKKTCQLPYYFSVPVCSLIADMLKMCPPHLVPDPSLHAGGMHSMWTGSFVGRHVDCSLHPLMPWEREKNLILYIGDADLRGGELLIDGQFIRPLPGRLVGFECSDVAHHSVARVTAGCRKALMVSFWRETEDTSGRRKAEFSGK